jgi:hypothetical protein
LFELRQLSIAPCQPVEWIGPSFGPLFRTLAEAKAVHTVRQQPVGQKVQQLGVVVGGEPRSEVVEVRRAATAKRLLVVPVTTLPVLGSRILRAVRFSLQVVQEVQPPLPIQVAVGRFLVVLRRQTGHQPGQGEERRGRGPAPPSGAVIGRGVPSASDNLRDSLKMSVARPGNGVRSPSPGWCWQRGAGECSGRPPILPMPPLQPREQPHPYAFLVDARHFFNAAVLVTGEVRDGIPVVQRGFVPYFLLSHSIELILKAFLLANGHDVADLASRKKGFSRNLLGLLAAARPHGLDRLGGFATRPASTASCRCSAGRTTAATSATTYLGGRCSCRTWIRRSPTAAPCSMRSPPSARGSERDQRNINGCWLSTCP